MSYKVLWIDDEDQGAFIRQARTNFDLDIDVAHYYHEGYEMLTNEAVEYQAVILDLNCKEESDNEAASLDGFSNHFIEIRNYCEQVSKRLIPWFVYTAGVDDAALFVRLLPTDKPWDKKSYYRKPADYKLLLENIKKAIEQMPVFQVRKKYGEFFTLCEEKQDELERVMIAVEQGDNTNASTFNDMRKVMGWVNNRLKLMGIFPSEVHTLRNATYYLRQISKFDSSLVPEYVANAFRMAEEATQNGSHGGDEGETGERNNNLVVDEDVKTGRAPYLQNCVFYSLLTVIRWCGSFSMKQSDIEERRNKVAAFGIPITENSSKQRLVINDAKVSDFSRYEGVEFILEQDENMNLHCESCLVSFKRHSDKIGKKVRLSEVERNSKDTGSSAVYEYFAQGVELVEE